MQVENQTFAESGQHTSLHPLQTAGRTREPAVEAEIKALLACGPTELSRRARQKERDSPDFVQEESLVYLLRQRFREGQKSVAGDLAEILVERSASFIRRNIAVWKLSSPQHVEECTWEVYAQMFRDLLTTDASAEFWEIRFWLCLKRKILNIVQKFRTLDRMEMHPDTVLDNAGHQADFFERQPDHRTLSAQMQLEIREALAQLPEAERIAFVLYYYEDWPQRDIASYLQVTDRTVRNLLGRAQARLEQWRTSS